MKAFFFIRLDIYDNPSAAEFSVAEWSGNIDLIVVDFYIPGYSAKDVIHRLRTLSPSAKIVCISASISPEDEYLARTVGADLYMLKHTEPSALTAAVGQLLKGQVPPLLPANRATLAALGLTARQEDILAQIVKGQSNKQIANALHISPETVKAHLAELYRRTNTINRVSLVNWARSVGILMENGNSRPPSMKR